ncbi:unnamed protein product [Kuraishia capsulata CBS 1993]|uniref:Proteasome assembly chaperone 2 n=1 Tax=Kuraishia capsulata CBS 1993 TaxID=1382522 RepID=W6MNZ5_9ASCO|nr:uncharacterized protein KUCA_T00002761001 [Kuraishia capsulata CBS 1993]CDK26787.1 unnamed protein product [Kuraishia capsulata CBS 1993]
MTFHCVSGRNPVEVLNSLQNSVLVIPSVSIGNIPQLSIDLLIHNCELKSVGYLDDSSLYPFVSAVDYVESKLAPVAGLSTALEVYFSESLKLTVIQQRSPILPNCSGQFLKTLIIPFIYSVGFSELMVVHSKDAGLKGDATTSNKFETWSNSLTSRLGFLNIDDKSNISVVNSPGDISKFSNALVTLLEDPGQKSLGTLKPTESEVDVSNLLRAKFPNSLPMSGDESISSKLGAGTDATIPTTLVSEFVYEGDNFGDAEELTNKIAALLEIDTRRTWLRPKSWSGVYGDRPIPVGSDLGIYS